MQDDTNLGTEGTKEFAGQSTIEKQDGVMTEREMADWDAGWADEQEESGKNEDEVQQLEQDSQSESGDGTQLTQTKGEATPAEPKITVKYNGEEVGLTQEELIAHAQKGLDYDRIRQDRDSLKNATEIRFIAEMAKANRMQPAAYMEAVRENMVQAEIENEQRKIMEEKGYDEQAAHDLAVERVERSRLESRVGQGEAKASHDVQMQTWAKIRLNQLAKEYPESQNIPEGKAQEIVQEMIKNNRDPVELYQAYLLGQQKAEVERLKQYQKNKSTVPGSAKGVPQVQEDEFLKEFMKD